MSGDFGEPPSLRERYIFHGRVQGMGFRYTTASIAKRFSVVGYVKNLSDGTVELVVEGSQAMVCGFLNEIASAFREHISESDRTVLDSPEQFTGFEIRS